MTIEDKIQKFIEELSSEYDLFKYIYNTSSNTDGVSNVYYSGPVWDYNEIIAAIKSLLVGKWLSSGESVYKFENRFVEKFNSKYAVMVNSGSSANLVMIAALKKVLHWSDDDEVILSVVGFPTTLSPILQNNLKPVFIDIEMQTLNFDVTKIEGKITNRTRAIFVSPVLGNPPDMDYLIYLCEKYKLELILDDCDSLGSKWRGKYLSEYSVASSYSFYPSHHITTGEGGMVTSNRKDVVDCARSLAWWGRDCYCIGASNLLQNGTCKCRFGKWLKSYDGIIDHKYVFTNVGYNLKPLDLQGAIGLVQLDKFDSIKEKRIYNKSMITNMFSYMNDFFYIPLDRTYAEVSWFGVPIIAKNSEIKNKVVEFLENNKIQTRNYFAGNILLHPAFEYLGNINDYPNANEVLSRVFFIGCSPQYTDEILNYMQTVVGQIWEKILS